MTPNLTLESNAFSLPSHMQRPPHSLELTVLFREFVQFWTGLKTEIPSSKPPQNMEEPIEFATRWLGSVKGTLVLRASRRFQEKLIRIFQEKGAAVPGGNALLQEMATLYSIFLLHYAWVDELFELGPILARPSQPNLWPSFEPHAFCAVEVEGEPVEIRLWMSGTRAADFKDASEKGAKAR